MVEGDMSTDLYARMRALSHAHFKTLWEVVKAGAELEKDDQTVGAAMKEHTEYHHVWERADQYGEREVLVKGANPFMHVIFHAIIENQIRDNDPPEVAETLMKLQKKGVSRHEAIHRLGGALAEETWHMLKSQKPYDAARYVKKIKRLLRA
jgi:hypothetical protein